ncbi:MAG: dihydrodipicolinate synthase family protein [Anaerolineales bacterium]
MTNLHPLAGVYAAAVTPIKPDSSPDLEAVPALLRFLASRGCHGALLFGTTGEGPSFSPREREVLMRSARVYRQQLPGFKLLAGTGTPSLSETIELTKLAFELGYDGVVVLPPYYFRKATDEGLFNWFSELITKAVPANKYLLGYHIPVMTGIGFSLDLLARLKEKFPTQFAGIKDSSHDENFAVELGKRFGNDLLVLNGTDSYFLHALKNHAQGAITAPANLISENLRQIWDLFQQGKDPSKIQEKVTEQRILLERYSPIAPILKELLHKIHDLPRWSVRLPLEEADEKILAEVLAEFSATVN